MRLKKVNNVRLRVDTDGEEVLISDKYLNECIEYVNLHRITKIDITDWCYEGEDVEFLSECPSVEDVSLDSNYLKDISGLRHLKNLTGLSLSESTVVDGNIGIDLETFANLESLYLHWSKKIKGLHHLTNLKELWLWKYAPKQGNLEELATLEKLEELTITQSKIRSLNGIRKLTQLKELELNYLRTLTSLGDIGELGASLKKLDITSCKNIQDMSQIQSLHSVEFLFLKKCGEVPSLEFIKPLTHLKHFVFPETNVLDGDITPCFHIDYVYFDSKKHYSHKWTDFKNWTSRVK
jgi:Leucine-rich repeat (LRR) protein